METVDLVRADFALIPANPLFDAVITASQAITDEYYYNANIIDAKTFPPHLSLHICTIPRAALSQVTAALERLAAAGLPGITPIGVEPSGGGYIMLTIERTPAVMALHETILSAAAQARHNLPGDPFGSPYIRDAFTPHISLAKLDRDDQADATAIGRQALASASSTPAQALELCDIGANSERWDTLASFPTVCPRTGGPAPLNGR
ncbi:MAG TPA: 2'-5' RNA ligase family protein [Streptosporangiaceae bacterium]